MSLFTVDAPTARSLAEADPAVIAGRFAIEVSTWTVPGRVIVAGDGRLSRAIADVRAASQRDMRDRAPWVRRCCVGALDARSPQVRSRLLTGRAIQPTSVAARGPVVLGWRGSVSELPIG